MIAESCPRKHPINRGRSLLGPGPKRRSICTLGKRQIIAWVIGQLKDCFSLERPRWLGCWRVWPPRSRPTPARKGSTIPSADRQEFLRPAPGLRHPYAAKRQSDRPLPAGSDEGGDEVVTQLRPTVVVSLDRRSTRAFRHLGWVDLSIPLCSPSSACPARSCPTRS